MRQSIYLAWLLFVLISSRRLVEAGRAIFTCRVEYKLGTDDKTQGPTVAGGWAGQGEILSCVWGDCRADAEGAPALDTGRGTLP